MRVFRKLLGLLPLLLVAEVCTGCLSSVKGTGPDGSFTPDEFKILCEQGERDVKLGSSLATSVVLLQLKEPERTQVAWYAQTVAGAVLKQVDKDRVTTTEIRGLVQDLIKNSNQKHKETVGLLLDAVTQVIDSRTGGLAVPNDDRATYVKHLIRGAAKGVESATLPYSPVTALTPHSLSEAWREDPFIQYWLFKPDQPYPWA